MRVLIVERCVAANRELAIHAVTPHTPPCVQRFGELERSVFHQLRVQPAVSREVDVFEEDTIHRRRDRRTWLADVERHHVLRRPTGLAGRESPSRTRESDHETDAGASAEESS